jgi:ketosteroid isomerase-like protein
MSMRTMQPLRVFSMPALMLVLSMSLSLGARGQSDAAVEEVKAVEQHWLENENNADVVQSILADDFVHVLPIGIIGKEDHVNFLRKHPNSFPGTKHFEELRVRVYGDAAIATGIVNSVRDSESKPERFAFTDVFVKRAGKWLAVNAQEIPLRSEPAHAA